MFRRDATSMRVVLCLRLLQFRRSIRRRIRGLIEDRWVILFYLAAFGGGAVWAYSTLPSTLARTIEASAYPIAAAATRTGWVLLLALIWRQLTLGLRYPPIYLARGDIPMLLAAPIDRRAVIALRLVRAYMSAGLTFAVPMILLGPFLVTIWDGASPARLALVWLHLSIGWICLIHWRWGTFHNEPLKRIARAVRRIGYALAGAGVLALLAVWMIALRTTPVPLADAALSFSAWTLPLPQPGAWSLAVVIALAVLSWIVMWRSVPRASLDGLVRFSLAISDNLSFRQGNQMEEAERLAVHLRGATARRRRGAAIGYRVGARAIAGRAVALALRQPPIAFAFVVSVYLGALAAFIYIPVLWVKALVLSVIATSIAKFPLASLYRDVGHWAFARQLPFTETEWVDGNAAVLWGWQTALGWVSLCVLFGFRMVARADLLPLLAFLTAAGYLVAQQAILALIAEVRADRFLRFAVHLGCLGTFAVLAGVVILPRAAGLPSWGAWAAATGAGVVLARAWRRIALRGVRTLIDCPWEVEQRP